MSQKYFFVVDSHDYPCNQKGESAADYVGLFPGAYAYESEADAEGAAQWFTSKTSESHAVVVIRSRFNLYKNVQIQRFD